MLKQSCRGFSLTELAIVLLIVLLLTTGLIVPLSAQVDQRRMKETQQMLEQAQEALLGYAAANGRLPCPATSASLGRESFDTALSGTAANGICSTFFGGFLPSVDLGLSPTDSQGFFVDAWGGDPANRIRYAVANDTVNGVANPFTSAGGMKAAGIDSSTGLSKSTNTYLYVCSSGTGISAPTNCGTAVKLTSTAPALVYSVGKNAATGGTSTDESVNPNPNGGVADKIYVSAPHNDTVGNAFDDQFIWISLNTLMARMLTAGRLP